MKKLHQSAFSLIEVLIFVTVFALFFIVAAAVTTVVLRDIGVNTKRVEAAHSSSELLEWLKYQKELGWDSFYDKAAAGGTTTTYCFISNNIEWSTATPDNCPSPSTGELENREAELTPDTDKVDIKITTSFTVLGRTYSSILNSQVSLYEQ